MNKQWRVFELGEKFRKVKVLGEVVFQQKWLAERKQNFLFYIWNVSYVWKVVVPKCKEENFKKFFIYVEWKYKWFFHMF